MTTEDRRPPPTPKQVYALAQGNWRRHANAKHGGRPHTTTCQVCKNHSRVLREMLVKAFE